MDGPDPWVSLVSLVSLLSVLLHTEIKMEAQTILCRRDEQLTHQTHLKLRVNPWDEDE